MGTMFDTLLLALDGSEHGNRALDAAVEMSKSGLVKVVHLVHVIAPKASEMITVTDAYQEVEHAYVATLDYEKSMGYEMLEEAARRFTVTGFNRVEQHVLVGDPAKRIIELAKQMNADLIVLGRRGLGGLSGVLLGSVTRKVEHAATCPVLTVV